MQLNYKTEKKYLTIILLGYSLAVITLSINKYPNQKICGCWIYFEKRKSKT